MLERIAVDITLIGAVIAVVCAVFILIGFTIVVLTPVTKDLLDAKRNRSIRK